MKERAGGTEPFGPLCAGDEQGIVADVEQFLSAPAPHEYLDVLSTRFFAEEAADGQQRTAADHALLHLDDRIVSPLLAQGHPVTVDTIRAFYIDSLLPDTSALIEPTPAGLRWQFSLPSPTHLLGAAKRRLAYYEAVKQERPYSQPHLDEYLRPLHAIVTALDATLPPPEDRPLDDRFIGTLPETEVQRRNVNYLLGSLYYQVAQEHPTPPLRPPRMLSPAPSPFSTTVPHHPRPPPRDVAVNHITAAYQTYMRVVERTAPAERFTFSHLLWGAEQQRKKFQELALLLQTDEFAVLIARYDALCDVLEQAVLTEANALPPVPSAPAP